MKSGFLHTGVYVYVEFKQSVCCALLKMMHPSRQAYVEEEVKLPTLIALNHYVFSVPFPLENAIIPDSTFTDRPKLTPRAWDY